ncbi:hypothetical protein [Amphritea pacifica]|uniref:Uncharacterized protein n=1 Tax=Amphritea pacifica TaxID=2811233 RepID=A0ABS2WCJ6_9GAMM|nr:hypothetical protein [Amphritea pacifica]MBN0989336.1 hypothetical protein [Amphritea pacifica]
MKLIKVLITACAISTLSLSTISQSADDAAFDNMLNQMDGQDTGSLWFDYYVAQLNQDIANGNNYDAYGAAGVNGPLSGFDGYISSFIAPDTGSRWFNNYVDAVNPHFS